MRVRVGNLMKVISRWMGMVSEEILPPIAPVRASALRIQFGVYVSKPLRGAIESST